MGKRKRYMTVSETMRAAILAQDASLREIARKTGVNHATIGRFVRGERGMNLPAVDTLAEALGLELRAKTARPTRRKG